LGIIILILIYYKNTALDVGCSNCSYFIDCNSSVCLIVSFTTLHPMVALWQCSVPDRQQIRFQDDEQRAQDRKGHESDSAWHSTFIRCRPETTASSLQRLSS